MKPWGRLRHVDCGTMLRGLTYNPALHPCSGARQSPSGSPATSVIYELPARSRQACSFQKHSMPARRRATVMRGTGQFFVGGNWKCNGGICLLSYPTDLYPVICTCTEQACSGRFSAKLPAVSIGYAPEIQLMLNLRLHDWQLPRPSGGHLGGCSLKDGVSVTRESNGSF